MHGTVFAVLCHSAISQPLTDFSRVGDPDRPSDSSSNVFIYKYVDVRVYKFFLYLHIHKKTHMRIFIHAHGYIKSTINTISQKARLDSDNMQPCCSSILIGNFKTPDTCKQGVLVLFLRGYN